MRTARTGDSFSAFSRPLARFFPYRVREDPFLRSKPGAGEPGRCSRRLIREQERWIRIAEEGLAAVDPANNHWKWDLLMLYWRTAHFTGNPVRQAALVVAMARQDLVVPAHLIELGQQALADVTTSVTRGEPAPFIVPKIVANATTRGYARRQQLPVFLQFQFFDLTGCVRRPLVTLLTIERVGQSDMSTASLS
jgi:hypothetical protein